MPEINAARYLVQAGWDSVPHLDEKAKADILSSVEPHLRDARTKGDPSMGERMVYPVSLADVEIQPFAIPAFWPRAYGLDVGWKTTAAIWGAWNPSDGSLVLYSEHYQGKQVPALHAVSIKARGEWIRGVVDPAAGGSQQSDGAQMIEMYKASGLHLKPADNSVEAGIHQCLQLLSTGRLKIFSTLVNLKSEFKMYRRDEEDRKVIKEYDHALDAMRYLVMSGRAVASVQAPTNAMIPVMHGDERAGY